MKTPEEIKREILDGLYRSKDGLSINETTELLNQLIASCKQPASLESLIERVEKEKWINPGYAMGQYNEGLDKAISILKSTPCIKAKALRKKGTDKWYDFDTYEDNWKSDEHTIICSTSVAKIINMPSDAELITIQILLP